MAVAFRPPRYNEDGRVFVKAYYDVMDLVAQEVITPTQAFLHTVIARAAYEGGGWTNLSHEQLAAKLHLKPGMLRAHLKKLDEARLVESRSRRGEGQAKDYRPLAPAARATVRILTVAPLVEADPNRQDSDTQPSGSCDPNHQDIDGLLKKMPVKTGVDGIPVVFRGEAGEAGASVAAAAAVVTTIADDDQTTATTNPQATPSAPPPGPRSSPPTSSAAPKTVARSVHRKPRTEPPEAIPIPPALLDWATEQGYTPEIIARETERCLDWHRVEGKPSADWGASLRTWLKHELAYSREDGRALGDHGGRPSRQHADGGGRDYYATRRGRLNEPVVGWPGAPVSDDALAATRVRRGLPQ